MIYRYDYVLSIWILVWFILYMTNIVKYNPIIILIISSFIDTIAIFFKIYNKEKINNILIFIIIQCFIKYIPLYLVWTKNIITSNNIISVIVFLLLYLLYMYINVGNIKDIIKIYDRMLRTSISKNPDDKYPITALIEKISK